MSVALPADKFGPWEADGFKPEADFIAAMEAVEGVSEVDKQTMTFMAM